MEMMEFVKEFNDAAEKSGKVYVDFKDGFFVADEISFVPSFNQKIVFLRLNGELVGRIDLAEVGGIEEY